MTFTPIAALVRNDLRLYGTDRRAIVVGILVPILIAAFFGYVFGGNGHGESGKIPLAIVDEDQSEVSRAITADLENESLVSVQRLTRPQAAAAVRNGKLQVAAILPRDFAAGAVRSLFSSGSLKPEVELLIDPSQSMSGEVVKGLFAQHSMQEITKAAFNGVSGHAVLSDALARVENSSDTELPQRAELRRLLDAALALNSRQSAGADASASNFGRGLTIPYSVSTTPVTSAQNVPYNGYAHSFAGMTIQFILLAGVDAGMAILLARERGIWQRLRSAPLLKAEFLIARTIATTLISLFQFAVIYAVAIGIFGVRIGGSILGFAALVLAICVMNACFGLMLAALGRSVGATRSIAMLVTLLMVMIGGAWVPSFVFPKWLQQASLVIPTRWAVDGLDAMTWRGLGWGAAVGPIVMISATAAVCLLVAIWRFRWQE